MISLYKTDKFHEILRNSGFIISTILIRLSFSAEGILNNALIVTSVLFSIFAPIVKGVILGCALDLLWRQGAYITLACGDSHLVHCVFAHVFSCGCVSCV